MHFPAQDNKAKELGAVDFYDEFVPTRYQYGTRTYWHFARYYFNSEGLELAYFIPGLAGYKTEDTILNIHPTPRVWGIPHKLEKL